jgi:hypothetical protein
MIRSKVHGKIFVSIDEAHDTEARYLEAWRLMDQVKCFCSQMSCYLQQVMFLLWPEGIRRDDSLLFLTNEDQYNLKAGQSINSVYMKLVHITC